ncbi:MAG: hypothetical protein IJP27_09410 [Clostridia bacterium]|nr:hypothetical protein [Clostridia bacterium]
MLFEEGGDHVKLNFIDVNQIKKNRVSAAQFGKQKPIASTLRNSQFKYSITDEQQKVNDIFYFPLFDDTVCADVIEKLETLIKEKRRETLGYGVVESHDVDTADRMREAVQRDIERYCEEHGIAEARENIWNTALEEKNTPGEGGVKYELRSDSDAEVQKAISDISYDKEIKLTDNSPAIIVLQKGARNLPLMIASHVRENILTEDEARSLGLTIKPEDHYHGLGKTLFLEVINDLDNITEAYRGTKYAEKPERREKYFLLISTLKDGNGDTINIPIYINEKGRYNNVFIDTNKGATVFGKINLREYIQRELRKKNIVRIKNRSIQTSESSPLIGADYGKNASNNISQKGERSQGNNNKNSIRADEVNLQAENGITEAEREWAETTARSGMAITQRPAEERMEVFST